MLLKEITQHLESVAPLSLQEDYDNSGLIVGHPGMEIRSAIISLDCTEAVIDEAIEKGANLVISHHPIVFSGLKKFNGKTYIERVVMKAIRHDIAIYAIHTNLDNSKEGVNRKIADRLGLKDLQILAPKHGLLRKLVTFCPKDHADTVRNALFDAGAGSIGNYSECSFNSEGYGTFKGNDASNAFSGEKGIRHAEPEIRIEVILPKDKESRVIAALLQAHPYEEVAYDLFSLANANRETGSGMVGILDKPMKTNDFLLFLKERMGVACLKHTRVHSEEIRRVAFCGGSGSFLLKDAIDSKSDIYITSDYKYHQFFDAEDRIIIADIGHYESEQFTMELLLEIIQKKIPTFALCLTNAHTNPVHYL